MSYTPAKVVAVFLAQFDVKKGYTMVWQKSQDPHLVMEGLDYKVLPLGIHEFEKTSVVFSVEKTKHKGQFYYGVARFQQLIVDNDTSDRKNVLMYLLGVVCDPHSTQWQPNQFIEMGWEYIDVLSGAVSKFEHDRDHQELDKVYDKLTGLTLPGQNLDLAKTAVKHHMLTQLPNFISKVGPLVFPLFKHALLRHQILFFNNENHQRPGNDYYLIYAYDYILSLISVVPHDVKAVGQSVEAYYLPPLYNVGLNQEFWHVPGYIATTNDDILMYNKSASDVVVLLNGNEHALMYLLKDTTGNQLGPVQRALRRDRSKLRRLVANSEPAESNLSNTDDLRLIHSLMSSYDENDTELQVVGRFPCLDKSEPAWWLLEACHPMLWRELLWQAWSWFALAGRGVNDGDDERGFEDRDVGCSVDFLQLVAIVGYFHGLTRRYFALINEIIAEQLSLEGIDSVSQLQNKISITVTYQDLIDMDLDPYSNDDHEFIENFVLKYFSHVVSEVEVGMVFANICC
ncbi:DUF2347 domain-containing protein [Kocuria palustris]|nr:DUF2347 domain-containing protein [Kocuria palustris]